MQPLKRLRLVGRNDLVDVDKSSTSKPGSANALVSEQSDVSACPNVKDKKNQWQFSPSEAVKNNRRRSLHGEGIFGKVLSLLLEKRNKMANKPKDSLSPENIILKKPQGTDSVMIEPHSSKRFKAASKKSTKTCAVMSTSSVHPPLIVSKRPGSKESQCPSQICSPPLPGRAVGNSSTTAGKDNLPHKRTISGSSSFKPENNPASNLSEHTRCAATKPFLDLDIVTPAQGNQKSKQGTNQPCPIKGKCPFIAKTPYTSAVDQLFLKQKSAAKLELPIDREDLRFYNLKLPITEKPVTEINQSPTGDLLSVGQQPRNKGSSRHKVNNQTSSSLDKSFLATPKNVNQKNCSCDQQPY